MPENQARSAVHGAKMIEVRVRFWTDKIAATKGQIIPKNAWDSGVVIVSTNHSHEIDASTPLPFNSMAELPAKIEKALITQGIKLHRDARSRKWIV